MQPFTLKQKQNIERGEILTNQLVGKVTAAFDKSDALIVPKRHHYIVGPAGIGKSVTVRNTAKKHRIPLIEIIGVASMNAIAIALALAVHNSRGKKTYVWIDDCDSVFADRTSLSVMKGALDEDRNMFAWNKNMTAMIQLYEKSESVHEQRVAEALRAFQTADGVGIQIPTDNINFIITSNQSLAPSNPAPKGARKIDESAIRDRVVYTEFKYDRDVSWGWTASVTMKNKIFDLTKAQKQELLHWLDHNWDRLGSVSMRAIKELAAEMINHPSDYPDYWETHLN
ncbi:hypothetical protein [Burkholderia phage FLC6]|nr:hypothetical protein [Burkholderia phage FLC6]BDD79411.1 hypothetical protein [Burkholderia phage FLC8]